MTQGSNLEMTGPLITMAEQPSEASCKEFSRLWAAASYRRFVENGQKGELASLYNTEIGFPNLDPASRPKLLYRFLCQGFVVVGVQADPTSLLLAMRRPISAGDWCKKSSRPQNPGNPVCVDFQILRVLLIASRSKSIRCRKR